MIIRNKLCKYMQENIMIGIIGQIKKEKLPVLTNQPLILEIYEV